MRGPVPGRVWVHALRARDNAPRGELCPPIARAHLAPQFRHVCRRRPPAPVPTSSPEPARGRFKPGAQRTEEALPRERCCGPLSPKGARHAATRPMPKSPASRAACCRADPGRRRILVLPPMPLHLSANRRRVPCQKVARKDSATASSLVSTGLCRPMPGSPARAPRRLRLGSVATGRASAEAVVPPLGVRDLQGPSRYGRMVCQDRPSWWGTIR